MPDSVQSESNQQHGAYLTQSGVRMFRDKKLALLLDGEATYLSLSEVILYSRVSQTFLVTEPFHIISKLAEPLLNSNKNKGKFLYSNQQLRLFI